MIHKVSLCSDKCVLEFSFDTAKFQLRYRLSSVQNIGCLRGGSGLGSAGIGRPGSALAKIKDQPSANQK